MKKEMRAEDVEVYSRNLGMLFYLQASIHLIHVIWNSVA